MHSKLDVNEVSCIKMSVCANEGIYFRVQKKPHTTQRRKTNKSFDLNGMTIYAPRMSTHRPTMQRVGTIKKAVFVFLPSQPRRLKEAAMQVNPEKPNTAVHCTSRVCVRIPVRAARSNLLRVYISLLKWRSLEQHKHTNTQNNNEPD